MSVVILYMVGRHVIGLLLLLLFIYYLISVTRRFCEYVIYRAEQFVFPEVICGEEAERTSEFVVYHP